MAMHIRNILIDKNSLWVRWIHTCRLEGCSFWNVLAKNTDTFGWKKLLQIQSNIRDISFFEIGNGKMASLWFDKWCEDGPLISIIRRRDIFQEEFKVADGVNGDNWKWLLIWFEKYEKLLLIQPPKLVDTRADSLLCISKTNMKVEFSVKNVWEALRAESNYVT